MGFVFTVSKTPVHPIVSAYMASIGQGYKTLSRDKRSLIGRLTAARRIATQRERYGPSLRGKARLKARGSADAALAWSGSGNPDSEPDEKG